MPPGAAPASRGRALGDRSARAHRRWPVVRGRGRAHHEVPITTERAQRYEPIKYLRRGDGGAVTLDLYGGSHLQEPPYYHRAGSCRCDPDGAEETPPVAAVARPPGYTAENLLQPRRDLRALLALDVKVILTPPCVFHWQLSIQHIQGAVGMTVTSTPRRCRGARSGCRS
jgi:hypothetical protein